MSAAPARRLVGSKLWSRDGVEPFCCTAHLPRCHMLGAGRPVGAPPGRHGRRGSAARVGQPPCLASARPPPPHPQGGRARTPWRWRAWWSAACGRAGRWTWRRWWCWRVGAAWAGGAAHAVLPGRWVSAAVPACVPWGPALHAGRLHGLRGAGQGSLSCCAAQQRAPQTLVGRAGAGAGERGVPPSLPRPRARPRLQAARSGTCASTCTCWTTRATWWMPAAWPRWRPSWPSAGQT